MKSENNTDREVTKMNVLVIKEAERYIRVQNDLNTCCNVLCQTHVSTTSVAQGHLTMMNKMQF